MDKIQAFARRLGVAAAVSALLWMGTACQLMSEMPYKSTLEAIAAREDQRVGAAEITPYLEYDFPMVRLRAALALARLRNPEAVDPIAKRLDEEPETRISEMLLFALGQIGSPAASGTLRKFFASSVDCVRAAAVEAAGKIRDEALTEPILVRLEEDASELVRAEACLALFRFGAVRYGGDRELAPELAERRRTDLEKAMLQDPMPSVRWRAAYALAGIQDHESAASLRDALLRDEDLWVRTFAARGLRAMPPTLSIQKALTEACEVARQRQEWQVVVEAISGLGNFPDLETAAYLIEYLLPDEGNNFHVRAAAARTLGLFSGGGDTILKALVRATTDPSRTVVGEAIAAMGVLGGGSPSLKPSVRRILETTAENEDRFIRIKTVQAAAAMGLEGASLLLKLSRDEHSVSVRCAALEALGDPVFDQEKDEIIVSAEEALAIDDLSLRYTGAELLRKLQAVRSIALLKSAYERSFEPGMAEARLKILEALDALVGLAAQNGELVDVAFFRKTVRDPDYAVRTAASKTLASLSGELVQPEPRILERQVVPRVGVDYMNGESNPVAHFFTEKGEFWVELFKEDAPTHVLSFLQLARSGAYNRLTFHRVVSNFVVQGLDPRGDGWGTMNLQLRDEINRRKFLRGYVGMPNAGRDTGGCQIFITHCPTPHLDGDYTVFGRVIEGMDVVDQIEVGDRVFHITIK